MKFTSLNLINKKVSLQYIRKKPFQTKFVKKLNKREAILSFLQEMSNQFFLVREWLKRSKDEIITIDNFL